MELYYKQWRLSSQFFQTLKYKDTTTDRTQVKRGIEPQTLSCHPTWQNWLLQPRMVQDLSLAFLTLPYPPMTCNPLPQRVCYSPSCVTHQRPTLVGRLRLWAERSGGACGDESCAAWSSLWLLPPLEAYAGCSYGVCTCNPKLEGISQRDWRWEEGRASTGSWPGRGPLLIPSTGAYANCARLLTQGECGVSHQIRTRGT